MLARNGRGAQRRVDGGNAPKPVGWRARHVSNKSDQSQTQVVLRGELYGSTTATAAGITATSTTPVLLLCRQLLAQGVDPDRAAEIYRGAVLALRIRSIGEAAGLEINGHGTGFRPAGDGGTASPVRKNGKSVLGGGR
jgi:hypothetical protein